VSSNIAQNYPYSSESETARAASVERIVAATEGLAARIAAEAAGLPAEDRWWVWKCPDRGCPGLLHVAGQARNARAIYAVCDRTGNTFLR
jgi:hypothetical protein